jgi:hypothetical protein
MSNDNNKELAELLKRARRMLNTEFLEKNSQSIPKFECDAAWLSKGIMLPYPPVVKFPTEKEVIAKALELYNLSNPNANTVPLVKPVDTIPVDGQVSTDAEPITENTLEVPTTISTPSPTNYGTSILEIYAAPTPSPELLPVIENSEPVEPTVEPIVQQEIPELVPVVDIISEETIDGIVEDTIDDIEEAESIEDEKKRTTRLRSLLNKFMSIATDLESKNKGTPDNV